MPHTAFPPAEHANPDGLLSIGGAFTPARIWQAHQKGIFPWFQENGPVMWWSPDPRAVIPAADLHISRSLKKTIQKGGFAVQFDRQFELVIDYCSTVHGETWITPAVKAHYTALFRQGLAHSCEIVIDGELAAGVYGVCLDRVFCAESMFGLAPNAGKIALAALAGFLASRQVELIDTQFLTEHLITMGARNIRRREYLDYLGGNPYRLKGSWADVPSPF